MESITYQLNSNVDIGSFFVKSSVGVAALPTLDLIGQVMTVVNVKVWQGSQGVEECGLAKPFAFGLAYDCCKVLSFHEDLMGFKQALSHCLDVEPIEPLPALLAKAKVKVKAIDICNDSFHVETFC